MCERRSEAGSVRESVGSVEVREGEKERVFERKCARDDVKESMRKV